MRRGRPAVRRRAPRVGALLHPTPADSRAAMGTLVPVASPPVAAWSASNDQTYSEARRHFDRELIQAKLAHCAGNVILAAQQLGLGRSTLYKKMAALGIAESQ